jgi:hypothetical protein
MVKMDCSREMSLQRMVIMASTATSPCRVNGLQQLQVLVDDDDDGLEHMSLQSMVMMASTNTNPRRRW